MLKLFLHDSKGGEATIDFTFETNPHAVSICFIDHGKPFNPLDKEDPDIVSSTAERAIGGLDIYITKNTMDEVSYTYADGCNRLMIKKLFS